MSLSSVIEAVSGWAFFQGNGRCLSRKPRDSFRRAYLCAMVSRVRLGFIEPCLPSPADKPPSGGYRLMVRRGPVGIRLLTRRRNDWSVRFPLVVEAVNSKIRSCLINGEVRVL
jgi:ATP-dependent DNA ligase